MRKIIIGAIGFIGIVIIFTIGVFLYMTSWKTATVDTKQSSDGVYELLLQSVGEPYWPFGAAPGQLVLKSGHTVVSKVRVEIANDGAPFSKRAWRVSWHENRVEVTLSGNEQPDEYVTIYFDGEVKTEREKIPIHYQPQAETPVKEWVLSPEEQRIYDGYQAIYGALAGDTAAGFEVVYGAKADSTRCVLNEDDETIEYLVYDRPSKNDACGLYVHCRSEKDASGTWYLSDGAILDVYAYVYKDGAVVSSGKTALADTGSEEYRNVTGE